ncbi:MAG: hypothetical protein AAF501_13545 [Pseudomonadota bacterium]
MDRKSVFESVIEPSIERVPVLELSQEVETDGIRLEASYLIERSVLTAFDRKLSDHLAAIDGIGFPAISLRVTVREPSSGQTWTPISRKLFATVPHALRFAGEFALGDRESCNLKIYTRVRSQLGGKGVGVIQEITRSRIEALAAATQVCELMGEYEYLHVTGNFSTIVVQIADHSLDAIVADLDRGTITVPTTRSGNSFVGPLFDPANRIAEDRDAASYMTQVNHKLALTKEKSIWDFRAAAEERIFGFNNALAGHPLTGYRLTAAETLVKRLHAGLGENLLGLSEEAQITALSWAKLIDSTEERMGINVPETPADSSAKPAPVRLISSD